MFEIGGNGAVADDQRLPVVVHVKQFWGQCPATIVALAFLGIDADTSHGRLIGNGPKVDEMVEGEEFEPVLATFSIRELRGGGSHDEAR